MISPEMLPKNIDPTQLTPDFQGSLNYDHSSWIDVRLAFEEFNFQTADLLDHFDDIQVEYEIGSVQSDHKKLTNVKVKLAYKLA